jgi:hypothetical protein
MPVIVQGTDFVQLPIGTKAQRPSKSAAGMMRVNTTTGQFEVYINSQWNNFAAAS